MVNDDMELRVGDRVLVPWGLDEVEGQITEIYNTGLGPRAQVKLNGDFNDETVVVPLDSLQPKGYRRVGNRLSAEDYEKRVGAALIRLIQRLEVAGRSIPSRDKAADFELKLGSHRVLVEAKYYSSKQRVSTDTVLTVAGLADAKTGALLISNVPLAAAAHERLDRLWNRHTRASFVQWQSQQDDAELLAALRMFT
jgi:hypothetical protein